MAYQLSFNLRDNTVFPSLRSLRSTLFPPPLHAAYTPAPPLPLLNHATHAAMSLMFRRRQELGAAGHVPFGEVLSGASAFDGLVKDPQFCNLQATFPFRFHVSDGSLMVVQHVTHRSEEEAVAAETATRPDPTKGARHGHLYFEKHFPDLSYIKRIRPIRADLIPPPDGARKEEL